MTPLSLSVTISFIFGNNSYNGNTQMPTQSVFSVMVAVLMHVRTIKQALMKLASTIGVNIIMVHYPPYCSKYNPIEHCMFGPISRSWSGAPLLSIENARTRAEATVTKKGLSIIATINQRTYETKRPIEESYESNKSKRIIFDDELSKWNYLVKCCS